MRFAGYDYTQGGPYFVTISVKDRRCLFGKVVDGQMHLNAWGRIADEEWHRTAELRPSVRPDAFVVMPNHVHGIIGLIGEQDDAAAQSSTDTMCRVPVVHRAPTGKRRRFAKPVPRSLSTIIGTYKAAVTRRINAPTGSPGDAVWQERFYDRIIRSSREHDRIRRYIARNPARWHDDRLFA